MNERSEVSRLDRLVMWLKRKLCKHVFAGPDMGIRDDTGWLDWPCKKCGKVYRVEYGLQVCDFGEITGPWGTPRTKDT